METLADRGGLPLGLAAILASPQHQVIKLLNFYRLKWKCIGAYGCNAEYAAQIPGGGVGGTLSEMTEHSPVILSNGKSF